MMPVNPRKSETRMVMSRSSPLRSTPPRRLEYLCDDFLAHVPPECLPHRVQFLEFSQHKIELLSHLSRYRRWTPQGPRCSGSPAPIRSMAMRAYRKGSEILFDMEMANPAATMTAQKPGGTRWPEGASATKLSMCLATGLYLADSVKGDMADKRNGQGADHEGYQQHLGKNVDAHGTEGWSAGPRVGRSCGSLLGATTPTRSR